MTDEVKEPDLDGSDNSVVSENSDVETKSQANWSDSFSEDEAKMVKDKGWKSPQDLLKSYNYNLSTHTAVCDCGHSTNEEISHSRGCCRISDNFMGEDGPILMKIDDDKEKQ